MHAAHQMKALIISFQVVCSLFSLVNVYAQEIKNIIRNAIEYCRIFPTFYVDKIAIFGSFCAVLSSKSIQIHLKFTKYVTLDLL